MIVSIFRHGWSIYVTSGIMVTNRCKNCMYLSDIDQIETD